MTKLRYSFGGGAAVRQPCAGCTGAGYERSTEPLKRLPILGGRHTHNDEQNSTGTALAGDKLGANHRLYAESGRQYAPGGQYRRRVGSGADGGADAVSRTQYCRCARHCAKRCVVSRVECCCRRHHRQHWWAVLSGFRFRVWQQPTNAHRKQVHGCIYVPAHRLMLSKGVAV